MTDYKTLLVHFDADRAAGRRLEAAIELARASDAHIACLYAVDAPSPPRGAYEGRDIVMEIQRKARAEMLERAQQAFEDARRRSGYERLEWRVSDGDPLSAIALHARYADLVVAGQYDPDSAGGVGEEFMRDLPLVAGRPVLVIPYAGAPVTLPRRVLVAWNAGREAARALTDALPLLRRAKQVDVLSVNPASSPGHGEEPGADIALFLARHGLQVTVSSIDAPDVDAGSMLLSRAFDLQSELIVSGAWGHSRLRESVLGGVTRTFLESMTVPVLMSH